MDISIFEDAPFDDDDAMQDFLMANIIAHKAVEDVLLSQGKVINQVPLGDIAEDEEDWLKAHEQLHLEEYNELGLSGYPGLTTVDFSDEQAYHDWMMTHAQVHIQTNLAAGL